VSSGGNSSIAGGPSTSAPRATGGSIMLASGGTRTSPSSTAQTHQFSGAEIAGGGCSCGLVPRRSTSGALLLIGVALGLAQRKRKRAHGRERAA
jgi:hypothetical protein